MAEKSPDSFFKHSRFPCLIQSRDHGLCASRPADWYIENRGPFHPEGFYNWLNDCPELNEVVLKKEWFKEPQNWVSLTGGFAGRKLEDQSHRLPIPPSNIIESLFNTDYTNAYRVLHPSIDSDEPVFVDRWSNHLLINSSLHFDKISKAGRKVIDDFFRSNQMDGVYFQSWEKSVRGIDSSEIAPRHLIGHEASFPLIVLENGLRFIIRFDQGLSVGLFLDHRENRRRWVDLQVCRGWGLPQTGELLNTFSYTCGFSLAAASRGWITTSLDLSQKYLEWGKENFLNNGIPLDPHDFIYGNAFDWMNRWKKRGREFDAIILDPPTFSKAGKKKSDIFRVEKDYQRLVELAGSILKKGGVLLASTNSQKLKPSQFVKQCLNGLRSSGHSISVYKFGGQGPDFMIQKKASPHLKAFWFQV